MNSNSNLQLLNSTLKLIMKKYGLALFESIQYSTVLFIASFFCRDRHCVLAPPTAL